jgi:hypothetical protein
MQSLYLVGNRLVLYNALIMDRDVYFTVFDILVGFVF